MVDEHNSRMKNKKKKRKNRSSDDEEGPLQSTPIKSSRKWFPEWKDKEPETEKPKVHIEESSPWRNLQLILSIQNKNLDLQTKLELAFNYVNLRTTAEANEITEVSETVSLARVVVFVGNWIQTVFITSVKKDKTGEQYDSSTCLDSRCWIILKFCLEESLKFNISLCILRDFLRVLEYIASGVLSHLINESDSSVNSVLSCSNQDLPNIVLDSVSLVFSSHGGVSNENLDLWITTICTVLKLLQKVVADKIEESRESNFVIKLSSYLLKPFADFLRVHPIRKNSFSDFIDRLLEPLMHLQDVLHVESSRWSKNLLELVNNVLAQGLFHQTHLDGYMSIQSIDKYKTCDGEKSKADVRVIKSYHRHLFDKLDKVIANKNLLPLGGIAPLFRLFVSCVTKHKGGSFFGKGSNANYLSSVDTERRKSVFDIFIQIMEYFLHQINIFTQAGLEVGISRLDVLGVLKSCIELLEAFKQEGIYTRLDDTSEGAGVKFLRLVYESVMSFSLLEVDDLRLSSSTSNKEQQEVRILLMKELVLAIHCIMDIEYEVVTNDLGHIWKLMISFSACSHSLVEASNHHLLNYQILHLGCRLIELYKELRQVNVPIFALCEALRLSVSPVTECRKPVSESYSSYVKSLSMLICAPEFRHSVCSAIKSIPEGQTSNCIQQLATDISDSIDWHKVQYQLSYGENNSRKGHDNSGFQYGLQMELMGRYLTEVYALILDSVTVTAGNSHPVSVSVNNLMAILCPSSSAKDSFFSFIFRRFSCDELAESHLVPHWILFLFFRLFLSCRNLSQQVFTLMPPNISKKMSKPFNDSFTAISGNDWLEYGSQNKEDSFSCIVKGSESVLTVVETVYDVYLHNSSTLCPPLVYVLCTVALQRLADLNRKLKSFEYILVRTSESIEKNTDETRKPSYEKENKKTMRRILNMKEEASGLVKFIIGIVEDNQCILLFETGSLENVSNGWDYSVGALNEKSLPYAVWLIVCQNVDLWCAHASKKAIKMFLTLLIRSSIPVVRCATKNVTLHQTSRELIHNTVLYEEKFVCRHLASTMCKILVTSASSIFPTLEDNHLNSIPNWAEIIDVLESLNNHKSQDKHAEKRNRLQMKLSSKSLSRLLGGSCRREQLVPERCIERSSSIEFLNFITWMPKGYLSSKSLLIMTNCVLNIERIVVGSLLSGFKVLRSEDQFDLLRLLLSCRRTLKSLFVTSVEKKTNDSHFSRLYLLSEGSSMVLWLFKSLAAVNKCHSLFSEDIASQTEDILSSLIDHTSSTLFTISKSLTERVIVSYEKDSGTDLVACLLAVGEKLRDEIRNSLLDFELSVNSGKGVLSEFQKLIEVTPVISCVQAFLWGIAFGLEITSTSSHTSKKGLSRCKIEPLRKLIICVDACTEFIKYFLDFLVLRDEPSSDQNLPTTSISEIEQQSIFKIGSKGSNVGSILAEDRLFDQKFSKGLFRGKNKDVTYFLRYLFFASSASLRLKINTPLLRNLVTILNSIPQYISLEFPNTTSPFAYIWLDGIVKFLEELGISLRLSNPLCSKNSFTNLIDLHLRFVTACIVINGKQADQVDYKRSCLIELKNRLKSSFRVLIQKSSESHLLSAIQIIEKAVCGLQEGSMDDIYSENFDGRKISATVAAGVECLDLVLEFVTGRKRMSMVKSHIRSIVSSIFSTIVSLQGPNNSIENKNGSEECRVLDSMPVVLTCVDVLTRVFGKHSVFQMDSSHITQSLHIPAVIFQNFLQLKHTEYLNKSSPLNDSEIGNKYIFDQRYSLELYAACCRLLCTVIKHHTSDAQRCIALLEVSVNVLLYCLEMINIDQGVKCALCLRRVYEELKQQKDDFGSYCYLFLSSYIWIYNGNGLLKYGIKREIDKAMRPGVYALIDSCSAEKLQHLHTVFGEGPCRITLGTLIDDYKLNFQYEGKV